MSHPHSKDIHDCISDSISINCTHDLCRLSDGQRCMAVDKNVMWPDIHVAVFTCFSRARDGLYDTRYHLHTHTHTHIFEVHFVHNTLSTEVM